MSELEALARKYVWWQAPELSLQRQGYFLCQLMQLGTFEDVRSARRKLGDAAFVSALQNAPPGVLDQKSWRFWHLFFGVAVPAMPQRPTPP